MMLEAMKSERELLGLERSTVDLNVEGSVSADVVVADDELLSARDQLRERMEQMSKEELRQLSRAVRKAKDLINGKANGQAPSASAEPEQAEGQQPEGAEKVVCTDDGPGALPVDPFEPVNGSNGTTDNRHDESGGTEQPARRFVPPTNEQEQGQAQAETERSGEQQFRLSDFWKAPDSPTEDE